jgi:hypothetical protein
MLRSYRVVLVVFGLVLLSYRGSWSAEPGVGLVGSSGTGSPPSLFPATLVVQLRRCDVMI